MMSSTRSIVAFAFLLAQLVPSMATAVAPLPRRESGVLSALLRSTSAEHKRSLVSRDSCPIGYLECDDGYGCCPIGQVCGTWGGKPGCCPIGKSCVANDNPCIYVGDVKCPGETFCCPGGDTCSRDSAGLPKCSYNAGGSGPTTTKSTSRPAITTSFNLPTPSATFNTPSFSLPSFSAPTFSSLPTPLSGDDTSSSAGSTPSGATNPLGSLQGGGALANGVAGGSVVLIMAGVAVALVAA